MRIIDKIKRIIKNENISLNEKELLFGNSEYEYRDTNVYVLFNGGKEILKGEAVEFWDSKNAIIIDGNGIYHLVLNGRIFEKSDSLVKIRKVFEDCFSGDYAFEL